MIISVWGRNVKKLLDSLADYDILDTYLGDADKRGETMLDNLQIVFWSVTYVLIIAAGWRSRDRKQVSIPYVAGLLNFGWELCALQQSQGFWGHILWLGLDAVIYSIGFLFLDAGKRWKLYLYIALTYVIMSGCWFLFALPDGMLNSSFLIDLIMAVMFLVDRKRLSPELKVPIAVFKLIGDIVAGVFYGPGRPVVAMFAVVVLFCNLCYLWLCCREWYGYKGEKGKQGQT